MIKLLYGDEPYLIEKEIERVTSQLSTPELNLKKTEAWDDNLPLFLKTYPFVDAKKVVVVDVDALKALDTPSFIKYLDEPSKFGDLLIRVRNYDARLKVGKELDKRGFTLKCEKLKSSKEVSAFILGLIKRGNGRITQDALDEIVRRENYLEAEISLFNIENDVLSMLSVNPDITLPLVKNMVVMHEVENAFAICSMIANKNVSALMTQAAIIDGNDAIKILSLVMREYRLAWKANVLNGSPSKVFNLSKEDSFAGLKKCQDYIDGIKIGRIDSSLALKMAFLELVG